jgi:hypothetical protein
LHQQTYLPRFGAVAREELKPELERLQQICNCRWEVAGDLLRLWLIDGEDDCFVAFTHPRTVKAFVAGYLRGWRDGYDEAIREDEE